MEIKTNLNEIEKLKYIVDKINCTPDDSIFVKKAKEIKIQYYTNSMKLLNKISEHRIFSYSFQNEIIKYSEKIQKVEIINKIIQSKKIMLERHRYAPELNKTYVNKRLIHSPHVIEIDKKITEQQLSENNKNKNLKEHLVNFNLNYLQILLYFN